MIFWDNIINTALLGTAKKPVNPDDLLKDELASVKDLISTEGDQEDKYLQIAALAFNFRQCGAVALHQESINFASAPEEEKAYCNSSQQTVLQQILDAETVALLELWLKACWKAELIVQPEYIPTLLEIASRNSALQKVIIICCGERGNWLAGFNPEWQFASIKANEDDLWTTGTFEQRKKLLRFILKQDSPAAKAMLQKTWNEENANAKTEFLKILTDFLAPEDEAWLSQIIKDKSQKVKQEAWNLLKRIPTSAISEKYKSTLIASFKKDSKWGNLIQWGSKIKLTLPESLDDEIFKSGIEKVSSSKGVSDESYILYQLIQNTPLEWIEQCTQSDAIDILQQFQKDKELRWFVPALADATANFKNETWAMAFFQHVEELYLPVASLLPQHLQDKYLATYLEKSPEEVLTYATQRKTEWSYNLAFAILKHTANSPYRYNKGFYNQVIHLIPDKIADDLGAFIPFDNYSRSTWYNLSDHLKQLLNIKKELKLAFPANQNLS